MNSSQKSSMLSGYFSVSSILGAKSLWRKLTVTFFILCFYRLSTFIPLPGLDLRVLQSFLQSTGYKFLGMFEVFSGGALGRASVMALAMSPYISASIAIQLLTVIYPDLKKLRKDGPSGRAKLNQYTRYLTLLLVLIQSYTIAVSLEYVVGSDGASAVFNPGWFFRVCTMVSLTGSTMFLMWLSEQISTHGIGNGSSIIIFTSIIANLIPSVQNILGMRSSGNISVFEVSVLVSLVITLIVTIVILENVYRLVPVCYSRTQAMKISGKMPPSSMPLKVNASGVLPAIFGEMMSNMPLAAINFLITRYFGSIWLISELLESRWFALFLKASLIMMFAVIYSTIVLNPEDVAEELKASGGYLYDHSPGQKTIDYFEKLIPKISVFGGLYIAIVSILPDIILGNRGSALYLSGTSLLIIVGVSLEVIAKMQEEVLYSQDDFIVKMQKAKVRRKMK